ncbi:MAG: MATE family efflux transporter [Brevinema sp.]
MSQYKRLTKKFTPILLAIGIPASLKMIAEFFQQFIDTIYVGQYNSDSLLAISSIIVPIWMIESIWIGMNSANTVMISQRIGSKDTVKASKIALYMFILGGICSGLYFIFWQLATPTIIQLMHLKGVAAQEGSTYLKTYSYLYLVRFFFVGAPSSALIAIGKTKPIMWATIAQSLTNIILNPILIWGVNGYIPELGLKGAAIGTVVAEIVCAIVISTYFWKHDFLHIKQQPIKPINFDIKERLILGIPITIEMMFWSFATSMIISMLNHTIPLGGAIFNIGFLLSDVSYRALYGFDLANMSLIGKAFGAKRKDRTVASIRSSLNVKLIAGSILFTILLVFQEPITKLFTSDMIIIQETLDNFSWILAISALLITVGINMSTLNGMGYSRYSLYISLVGISLRILISWWVIYHTNFGIAGVWAATFTEEAIRLLATYLARVFLLKKYWKIWATKKSTY